MSSSQKPRQPLALYLQVIYVCRNPKDVCVSLLHHTRNKPQFEFTGGFSDILPFFAEGR